jgi:hypothetical protein
VTPDRAPARPAGGTGAPRREGDGIAVDIATRAGLLTVVFTSPASASARPTGTAFSYRGRHYTGSVYLAGPSWRGTPGPGLSLFPAGSPAGPGVAATIADIIGAAVAAWLGDHPGILDLAAQAAAAAARARAQRELELLQPEITAAGQHLFPAASCWAHCPETPRIRCADNCSTGAAPICRSKKVTGPPTDFGCLAPPMQAPADG